MSLPGHARTSLTVRFDDPALLRAVKEWATESDPRLSLNAAINYLLSAGLLVASADRTADLRKLIDTTAALSELTYSVEKISQNLGISLDSRRNHC